MEMDVHRTAAIPSFPKLEHRALVDEFRTIAVEGMQRNTNLQGTPTYTIFVS